MNLERIRENAATAHRIVHLLQGHLDAIKPRIDTINADVARWRAAVDAASADVAKATDDVASATDDAARMAAQRHLDAVQKRLDDVTKQANGAIDSANARLADEMATEPELQTLLQQAKQAACALLRRHIEFEPDERVKRLASERLAQVEVQ